MEKNAGYRRKRQYFSEFCDIKENSCSYHYSLLTSKYKIVKIYLDFSITFIFNIQFINAILFYLKIMHTI